MVNSNYNMDDGSYQESRERKNSKEIEIKGKWNRDAIEKLKDSDWEPKRCESSRLILPSEYFQHHMQIKLINSIYLNTLMEHNNIVRKYIENKLKGYQKQDIEKDRTDDGIISIDSVIEILVISRLKCFYCKENVHLLYESVRDKNQWTLDRIDNNKGHIRTNVVVSCLECNLERRCQNAEKFKFTKQLKIKKL